MRKFERDSWDDISKEGITMKKIYGLLITFCLVIGLLGGSVLELNAEQQTESSVEVTRLEWLKALTEAFEMQVEEHNYPDNYYSDIDATSEDYYDIMLATEFGLIDVEAGDALRPDDVATREFAAHTLNLCMGYFTEEASEYTFSEADAVTYPEDIQIAIDKGWLELSGNDFLPEQGITVAEKDKMIAAAESVVASTVIDSAYEGQFELVEGVIVIPEETEVLLTDENELTINNCSVELSEGDIFVVFSDGFPIARKAVTITKDGDTIVVIVESVELEEAFVDLDLQGNIDADLTQVQAVDDDVELAYIVGGTEEQAYEDGVTFYSLDEVEEQEVTAVIATKTIETTDQMRRTYGLKPEENISIKCKITKVSADYDVSIFKQKAYLNVSGTVTFSANISSGDIPIGFEDSLVRVPIGAIGYFKPQLEANLSGTFSLSMKSKVSAGVQWTAKDGVRLNSDFKKEAFTIQAQIEGKVGVKVAIGVDVGFVKAELYARAGGKASVAVITYTDNKYPPECRHVTAHLYCSIGGKVTFKLIIFKAEVSLEKVIFNEENSPVKIALHYENGEPVSECTRDKMTEEEEEGESGSSGTGSGSSSNGTTKQYKYYTPIDSQYTYSGANTGKSSTGETYTIFEYSLDDNNQATITKYNGNVSALNIPETIDGYTVVGIDEGVFENNTRLMLVNIPNTVTEIDTNAFANCSNLVEVTLSDALVTMGYSAFYNCDSLTSIEIPKSLEKTTDNFYNVGVFRDCDNLKTVTFETGTTEIATCLFSQCTGLEEIIIPDTVTVIESEAFAKCTNLRKVIIPSSVTNIENNAFAGCTLLSEIQIPDSVVEIGYDAFADCSNLAKVTLSKSLTTIGYSAFYNCDSLTSIEIPKSLKAATDDFYKVGVFRDCDNLKTITFEIGTTEIATCLFSQCTGLEEISIPDTVTVIESEAFAKCTNLKKVIIPSSVTSIGNNAFAVCTLLTEIQVPDSVVEIEYDAFSDCSNLAKVTLSKSLVTLGYSAFYNCDSLTSIEIPKSLKIATDDFYKVGAFRDCDNLKIVTFEEGTTKIVARLFSQCTGLEEIIIPNTVTIIEDEAFSDCVNLQTVQLSNKLENINDSAFRNCSSLLEISLPDTVTSIGTYVFTDCSSLKKAKLPSTLKIVAEGLFQNCAMLTTIELPDSIIAIENKAFQNSGLTKLYLPQNIETIEPYSFNNCDVLQAISIPDSVTVLGTYSFADCEKLSDVDLGTGLTQINSYAFNLCPAIQKIVLPYRMSTVAANAFTNCTNLTEITIPRATGSIADNAFSYPTKMTVYGVTGTYAEEWADSVGATFVNQEKPATAVTLGDSALTINNGDTTKLTLSVTPADFTDAVTWKSSDETVATISDAGVVTAKGAGSTTIRISVGNVSTSCKVTVVQPVTRISLNKLSRSLEAQDVYTLKATVIPSDANDKTVTWSSSDETIATVSQEGVVTALKKGTAVITVTANDGSNVSQSCTITVTNNCYKCESVEELESPHNYENACSDVWTYTLQGAKQIAVTFDEKTEVEEEFDYLYLYDSEGNEVGKYTGTELAGQTVIITGDTVKVKLISDDGGNAWGFKIAQVVEYCEHTYSSEWSSDESYHWHAATCGHVEEIQGKEEHSSGEWIIDKEATIEEAGSRHKECTVCGKILETEEIAKLVDPNRALEERLDTAVTEAVDAAVNLTPENYEQATDSEKQQAVAEVLVQVSDACEAQNITQLGELSAETAIETVGKITTIEEQISTLLGTSVKIVAKQEATLAVAQDEVISVSSGASVDISELSSVSSGDSAVVSELASVSSGDSITTNGLASVSSGDVAIMSEAANISESNTVQMTVQEFELPTVQNALLSVPAGENAIIEVGQVENPTISNVDTVSAVTFTMELFSGSGEKMNLKAPVIVTLPIPEGIDAEGCIKIYHFQGDSTEYTEIIPVKVDTENNTITFVTGSFSTFTVTSEAVSVEISGAITSFGDNNEDIKISFCKPNGTVETILWASGDSTSYQFIWKEEGTYLLEVSKKNHVTRTYSVLVEGDVVNQDVVIQLLGDVTGDGTINARDKKLIYNHIAGTRVLQDYDFAVGDVTKDGVINARDKKLIYNHIAGTSSLWK